jgi:hypothetical protein
VAIDFPDSQQPVRDISEFNVIRYFNDVTPL